MQAATQRHEIASGRLAATIKPEGAELTSLRGADGVELLWQAGPQWPRHAPLLFPIVGRLTDDTLRHEGRDYRMTQHGFARDSLFDWVARDKSSAHLRLADSDATRALYPFAFTLDQIYSVEGATLVVTTIVGNPGDVALPCAVGAHPAFAWPLAEGAPQTAHHLDFSTKEAGEARALTGGLLDGAVTLPLEGRRLPLSPELFAADALVLPDVRSRSVRFVADAADGSPARALTIGWDGYRDLGLWSKPDGAPFLCIEPWFGMASPLGWKGEFAAKPGLMLLAPGESRRFIWSVTSQP
jgi:galactose mutarotase-like enzyme